MAEGGYINIRVPSTSSAEINEQIKSTLPNANRLSLNKSVLAKTNYNSVIDTSFTELVTPSPPVEDTISVSQFFRLYDDLFYDIPAEGETNSHEVLIQRSSQYIGFTEENSEEIQALLDEITNLRQNLLDTEIEVNNLRASASLNT